MTTVLQNPPGQEKQSHTDQKAETPRNNVGNVERAASVAGGTWLALHGLRHGGLGGVAMLGLGAAMIGRGATGHCGAYDSLGIDTSAGASKGTEKYFTRGIHVVQSFTINKPSSELFSFWRNFENLPQFMTHLREVTTLDEKRSRWKANAPAGATVEWEAEIINEEKDRLIAWQSIEGSGIANAGSVRFMETGDRGTEVRVVLDYIPPAGRLGWAVAKLFGEEPSQQVREDLRRFKQLMETGEIPTTRNQPRGSCGHSRR
ncbi:MAG: DUF2892 domain-containing protein [Planctomycetota bacterium]|nr:DUF2892 domain-containing protein [Planctomycetota bacterium]